MDAIESRLFTVGSSERIKRPDDEASILYFTIVGYFTIPIARNRVQNFSVTVRIATQGPHSEMGPSGTAEVTIAKRSRQNFPSLQGSRSKFSFSTKVVITVATYRGTKKRMLIPSCERLRARNSTSAKNSAISVDDSFAVAEAKRITHATENRSLVRLRERFRVITISDPVAVAIAKPAAHREAPRICQDRKC